MIERAEDGRPTATDAEQAFPFPSSLVRLTAAYMAFFRTVSLTDVTPAIAGEGVVLRPPQMSDCSEWAALREAKAQGVHVFCVTVDREGSQYLTRMYGDVAYVVIDRVEALPERLPRIYRVLTT